MQIMPLARSFAKTFASKFNAREHEEDLVSICAIAIMRAEKTYNPGKGACFRTYASQWAYTYCRREVARMKGPTVGDMAKSLPSYGETLTPMGDDDITPQLEASTVNPEEHAIARQELDQHFEATSERYGARTARAAVRVAQGYEYAEIGQMEAGISKQRIHQLLKKSWERN